MELTVVATKIRLFLFNFIHMQTYLIRHSVYTVYILLYLDANVSM